VLSIARGKKYLSPEVAQNVALGGGTAYTHGLTQREFDVLRLIIQGQTVQKIADALGLNSKTVANHQSAVRQKLGAETTIDLLRRANELGLAS
jgi:two-component system invasion response regulator UvrY